MSDRKYNKLSEWYTEQEGSIAIPSALVANLFVKTLLLVIRSGEETEKIIETQPDGGVVYNEKVLRKYFPLIQRKLADLTELPDEYHHERKKLFLKGQSVLKSHVLATIKKKISD